MLAGVRGLRHAIPARAVRTLVAGEDRGLRGRGAAGALDRLPGGERRPRRPAGHRGDPPSRRLGAAVPPDHAGDHAGTTHPQLSPHHSGAPHARRGHRGLRRAASVALRARPAFRSAQGGERDRAAHLPADRGACADRPRRPGLDLDRCRHSPPRLAALERPPPCRLWARPARRRAFLHPVEARHLPAGNDGGVPDLAAGLPGSVPAQRRGARGPPPAARRRRRGDDGARRSNPLHAHERGRRAPHPARPFRPRDGGAAGLVGAGRRPPGRRRRTAAAEAGASAAERAPDRLDRPLRRDPGPVRQLIAKPRRLALGVAPGVALGLGCRCREIDLAAQMPDQPGYAVRLHRRERGVETPGAQRAHLVQGAGGEHPLEAGIDAAVKLAALDVEEDLHRPTRIERGPHAVAMPVGERAAGRQDDLERASDAGAVARHQPLRGRGVALAELGVKAADAFLHEPAADRGADLGRDRGDGSKPARQRPEVEAGAADQDRPARSPRDLVERRAGFDAPAADGIILGGVHVAIEEMGHARLLHRRRARGDDAQIAIDLHGIGIDDGAAELLRQRERQRRLAARGRSRNEDGPAHDARAAHGACSPPPILNPFPAPTKPWADPVLTWRCPVTLVRPFRALRPAPGRAAEILAPPYDVLSSAEARERAQGKPWSFLHVSKPEIDLDPAIDPHDRAVYAKAAENLERMIAAGVLVRDAEPCYYVYRLTRRDRQQTGLAAVASLAHYRTNRIRKHEHTTPVKEDDRVRQIEAVDDKTVAALTRAFDALPALYIGDGHHRTAAADRVAQGRGGGAASDFLTVIFPHHQMTILDYNRVLRNLNGHGPAGLLAALRARFAVAASDQPVRPAAAGEFGMYLAGRWYRLTIRPDLVPEHDPIGRLPITLLTRHVIEPLFGITDPRTDQRIDFVGGGRGLRELERRVAGGEMAVAFALYPTQMADLMAVADAGGIMPPKSTWFEPKLADGMVSHVLD